MLFRKQEAAGSPGGYFNQSHQEGQWNFDLLESKSTGTSSNEQVRSTVRERVLL